MPTNKVFMTNFAKKTTNHLEMSYSMHFCIVIPPNFVFLTYEGTTRHSTNSRPGTSLWLSPTKAPGDIWTPLTVELLSQYVTTGSCRYDIPWGIFLMFFRYYHLPNLLLYVRNYYNDVPLWYHLLWKNSLSQDTINPPVRSLMFTSWS